jgi:hypothetical protein
MYIMTKRLTRFRSNRNRKKRYRTNKRDTAKKKRTKRRYKRGKQLRGGLGDEYNKPREVRNPLARLQESIGVTATADVLNIGIDDLKQLSLDGGINPDIEALGTDLVEGTPASEAAKRELVELIIGNAPAEQRVGIISGHGGGITDQFTIVPESMGSFSLYSSSGESTTAHESWVTNQSSAAAPSLSPDDQSGDPLISPHKNDRYSGLFLRSYEGGALIPDYIVNFDYNLPKAGPIGWEHGGVFTENVVDFIRGNTIRGQYDRDDREYSLDNVLEKHNEERSQWDIDPSLDTKKDHPEEYEYKETKFRLSYLFKKIAQAPPPKPITWFGVFCRSQVTFTIDDLKTCSHEDYDPLPEDFFSAKIGQDKEVVDRIQKEFEENPMHMGHPVSEWDGPLIAPKGREFWAWFGRAGEETVVSHENPLTWAPITHDEMLLKREKSLSTNVRTQSFKKMLDDLAQIKEFGETPSDPKFRSGIVAIHQELESETDPIKIKAKRIFMQECVPPEATKESLELRISNTKYSISEFEGALEVLQGEPEEKVIEKKAKLSTQLEELKSKLRERESLHRGLVRLEQINENIKLASIWVKHFNFTPLRKEEVCFILLLYNKIFTQGAEDLAFALVPSDAAEEIPPKQLFREFEGPSLSDLRDELALWDDSVTGSDHPEETQSRSGTPPPRRPEETQPRSGTPPRRPEETQPRSGTPPRRPEETQSRSGTPPPRRPVAPEPVLEPTDTQFHSIARGGRTKYEEPRASGAIHTEDHPDRRFHRTHGRTGVQEHTKRLYDPRTWTGQFYGGGKRTPRKRKHKKRKHKKRSRR